MVLTVCIFFWTHCTLYVASFQWSTALALCTLTSTPPSSDGKFFFCERLLAFSVLLQSCAPSMYYTQDECVGQIPILTIHYTSLTLHQFYLGNGTFKSSLQSSSTKPSGQSKLFNIKNRVLLFFLPPPRPYPRQCPLCIHSQSSGLIFVAAKIETLLPSAWLHARFVLNDVAPQLGLLRISYGVFSSRHYSLFASITAS